MTKMLKPNQTFKEKLDLQLTVEMKLKIVRRMVIMMWAVLGVCFVIKLLGGNWFEPSTDNERYIKFCDYVDTHLWAEIAVTFPMFCVSNALTILAMAQQFWFTRKQLAVCAVGFVGAYSLQHLGVVGNICGSLVTFLVLPLFVIGRQYKRHWNILIGNALVLAFQGISLLTKNIALKNATESTLTTTIYMFDAYIMIATYYLYANLIRLKKEKEQNG